VALLAVHVAAFFHVAGGGAPPAPVAIALTLAGATPLCIALAGQRLGALRVTTAVVLTQFLLHTLFSLGRAAGGPAAGHVHDVALALPAGPGTPSPMWQAHALAALVTVAALSLGGRALALGAAALRLIVLRLLAFAVPLEPATAPSTALPERPQLVSGIAAVVRMRHRGPPVLLS